MIPHTLALHFRRANDKALHQARQFVQQNLPDEKRFLLRGGNFHDLAPLDETQTLRLLWRDLDKIATVWVMVKAQNNDFTLFDVYCYPKPAWKNYAYRHENHAPFEVLVPPPPFEWRQQSAETRGKFDLYWNDSPEQ